jgi:hypothetical protein
MTKAPIFLSSSIPDRDPYVGTADPIAIREAILALVAVVVPQRRLVFGGHPAITPLVYHAAVSLDAVDNVDIFQTEWFRGKTPPEAQAFSCLKWTTAGGDEAASLEIMRREMIESQPFCAAVFIGGMEGIPDECRMFKAYHPNAVLLPIASTGGATRELWDAGEGPQDPNIREALLHDKKYRPLLRKLLC